MIFPMVVRDLEPGLSSSWRELVQARLDLPCDLME